MTGCLAGSKHLVRSLSASLALVRGRFEGACLWPFGDLWVFGVLVLFSISVGKCTKYDGKC